jgi:LCP family protein required for cell wall assembly
VVLSIPRVLKVQIPGHGLAKINDAYAFGGPSLAIETLRQLTGLKIHHVVNVNFKGFRSAINLFDCFYVDVDRRYFHSNVGVPISQRYDAIDIQPGYQRLCGIDALDYVRFRHADTDLVRAARQQDFLRAAKDQISTSRLIDDLQKLGEITSKATQTDKSLRTKTGFLRVAKLALQSADHPVRQLDFPASFIKETVGEQEVDYVESNPVAVAEVVDRFLHGGTDAREPLKRKSAKERRRRGSVREAGFVPGRDAAEKLIAAGGRRATTKRAGLPVRFPSHVPPNARYEDPLRIYSLRARDGTLHRAYRLVLVHNRIDGQFYGVQGTTWRNPPLLAQPSAKRKVRGRRLELFRSGSRLRFVAWRTSRATYWISNTLNLKLTDAEMLALAASLTTKKR